MALALLLANCTGDAQEPLKTVVDEALARAHLVVTYQTPRCAQFQIADHVGDRLEEALAADYVSQTHGREESETMPLGEIL